MIPAYIFVSFVAYVTQSHQTFAIDCPEVFQRYNQKHSYCLPANKSCQILAYYPNKDDIKNILDLHNTYRSVLATGKESLPQASDMLQMQWDDELASVAQKYAEQCLFEHDCANCRRVKNFGVGQNLALQTLMGSSIVPQPDWTFAVSEWYSEIIYFPKNNICPFNPPEKEGEFRHFSQLVWAKTFRVGCGYVLHKEGNVSTDVTYIRLYVCNYGPAANVYGECMYDAGPACWHCPSNTCCGSSCGSRQNYPGLCRLTDDKAPYYPPSQPYMFYCDFRDNDDCKHNVQGNSGWAIQRSLEGNYLEISLRGGENSTLTFMKKISSNVKCITLLYRKGPSIDGNEDANNAVEILDMPEDNYTFSQPLPGYDEDGRHQFSTFKTTINFYKDTQLKLSFAVPPGKPMQFFNVLQITALGDECVNE